MKFIHTDASTLKYLTTMKNQFGLFTRWYQELAGLNFTVVHKKGKENSNTDALSWSAHMVEAPPLEGDKYAEFYKVDEPVIRFEGGMNEIQHLQCSTAKIVEEQAKDDVWSEVISWVDQEQVLLTKAANRNKIGEVWQICLPRVDGVRGMESMLSK